MLKKGSEKMKKLFKFVLFGISNVIPGVCSATMAMIMKIYDDLLNAIIGLGNIKKWREYYKVYIAIAFGILIGIFLILKLYSFIPFILNIIFLGIVIRSFPIKKDKEINYSISKIKQIICFIIGLVIVMALSLLNRQIFIIDYKKINLSFFIVVILNGVLASIGMILPGISGALMLVIFGLYFPLLDALARSITKLIKFTLPNYCDCCLILIFMVSFIMGLIFASKVVKTIMNKKNLEFLCLINGMVIATIINLFLLLIQTDYSLIERIIGVIIFSIILIFRFPYGTKTLIKEGK